MIYRVFQHLYLLELTVHGVHLAIHSRLEHEGADEELHKAIECPLQGVGLHVEVVVGALGSRD